MKLTELLPRFRRVEIREGREFHMSSDFANAMGIQFLCPKCFREGGGPVGTHAILCWSAERGTPADVRPLPGRWAMKGTGYNDLTLDGEGGKSRSILLMSGCKWHGFVVNGDVTDA